MLNGNAFIFRGQETRIVVRVKQASSPEWKIAYEYSTDESDQNYVLRSVDWNT